MPWPASLGAHILKNKGQMLENMVFTGLRRVTREIYYYKTKQGYEVDFLAIRPDGGKMLVRACELLDDQTTKAREVRALAAAMEETGVRHGWILADSHQEEIKVSAGTIHCVPRSSFPDGEGITLRLISHSPPGKEPIICCHCFRMTVTQYIENLYDRLKDHLHEDYLDLYPVPTTSSLRLGSVFSTLHHNFLESFKLMNSEASNGRDLRSSFWADASRDLIALIDQTEELQTTLKSTELAFSLEPYYLNVIEQCKDFLSPSGGVRFCLKCGK